MYMYIYRHIHIICMCVYIYIYIYIYIVCVYICLHQTCRPQLGEAQRGRDARQLEVDLCMIKLII